MQTHDDIFDTANKMIDDVRYFVEKKSDALKCLIAHETENNAKGNQWYRNLAVERKIAMPLDFAHAEKKKRVWQTAVERGILEHFEHYVCQVEDSIFDGIFSASEIEKKLQLVIFSENLNASQSKNIEGLHNNPFRETIVDVFKKAGLQDLANKVATGQQLSRNVDSLTEKKNFYQEVFDDMSEAITTMKGYLKEIQGAISEDNRLLSLLERYEWCEQTIGRVRTVVRDF